MSEYVQGVLEAYSEWLRSKIGPLSSPQRFGEVDFQGLRGQLAVEQVAGEYR